MLNQKTKNMKKLIYSVAAVAAFAFASCGGPSVCDCVNAGKDADDKTKEKCEAMEKEWKEKYDKASDDEKKKLMEEIQACEKEKK